MICNGDIEKTHFKNVESPFTELFFLLKKHEIQIHGHATLAYKTDELKVMQQHVDNAMSTLLQGLQDLGQIIGVATQDKKMLAEDLNNIGLFISAISNLTEALNTLRLDTSYVLEERIKEKL